MVDREGVIARIRQVRRVVTARDRPDSGDPQPGQMQSLEARVAQLEKLVEGLQDSVHRESERHAKLIAELQNQVRPDVMSEALAKDARERGL
ncbi:MAG: hypothetical protein ACXVUX_13075 [Solirubrobacteraceae bacterium]